MPESQDTYEVNVGGLSRDLPLFEVAPGVRIAILNILGDTAFVETCARELAARLDPEAYDVLVTAEAKSIPLIYALAAETRKPWVVLRKSRKLYMGDSVAAETVSITTGRKQTLYLDEKDLPLIRDQRVCLVDDVISTGSTQRAMRRVVEKAGGEIALESAIFTEGDLESWAHIISLGHLPVFE